LCSKYNGAFRVRPCGIASSAPEITEQGCHSHHKAISVLLFRYAQGQVIDPVHMLPAMSKVSEISETCLNLSKNFRQHSGFLFRYFHECKIPFANVFLHADV